MNFRGGGGFSWLARIYTPAAFYFHYCCILFFIDYLLFPHLLLIIFHRLPSISLTASYYFSSPTARILKTMFLIWFTTKAYLYTCKKSLEDHNIEHFLRYFYLLFLPFTPTISSWVRTTPCQNDTWCAVFLYLCTYLK